MYKIVKKEKLNDSVTKMVIEAPFVAAKADLSFFVLIKTESVCRSRLPIMTEMHKP